jgi:hypothetical protein
LKRADWQVGSRRTEQQYYRDISDLMSSVFADVTQGFDYAQARLLSLTEFIDRWAQQAATRMVTSRLQDNSKTWRAAAREAMRTPSMHRALRVGEMQSTVGRRYRELINQNALLIKSLPQNVARLTSLRLARQQQAGRRSAVSAVRLMHRVSRRVVNL